MTSTVSLREVVKRPVIALGALLLVVVVVAWLFAFFLPQSKKLSALQGEKASLEATIARDDARVQLLRTETHHVGRIESAVTRLGAYVPKTEDLYTYVQTLSRAGKKAGVRVTSLEPGSLEKVTGTSFSAVPITASLKGTYDHVLAFLADVYALPRLTDVNAMSITGGGPGTARATVLSVTFELAIFTSQSPSGAG